MKNIMKFILFIVVIFIFACTSNEKTCNCESNFDWVKKTFEENDAGFQHIIDKKGQEAYNNHNQLITEKIKTAKTLTQCAGFLYEWLLFFRSGHIGIELLASEIDEYSQTKKKGVYETINVDISQFEEYLDTKKEADYEGIWEMIGGMYKIGIKKEGENYIGFIIASNVDTWKPYMVKMKIEQYDDKVKTIFYMRDHFPIECEVPELIGNNYLQIDQVTFKRRSPIFPNDTHDLLLERYFKSIDSPFSYMEDLNTTTLYFRIPSFGKEYKYIIDKMLADNIEKILKTDNLIIDLRDNGGGTSSSYVELIPLLYTDSIQSINVEYLSSKLNNRTFLEYSYGTKHYCGLYLDENARQWARIVYYHLIRSRFGEFVALSNETFNIIRQDTVYEYPKNVGILINEGCASTTEEFLFIAKQSKKVKLFGVPTYGAFDISAVNCVESPCKEFRLWYCMSRTLYISEYAIDDIGMQPDYYLDETIPQYEWVELVNEILNQ